MTIYGDEQFLYDYFEKVEGGWIAYKTFNMFFPAPDEWELEVGNLIFTKVDTDHTAQCSYGINVGPSIPWLNDFVIKETVEEDNWGAASADIWKLLIPEGAEIVAPRWGGGKIRVDTVQLLEKVGRLLYQDHPDHPVNQAI